MVRNASVAGYKLALEGNTLTGDQYAVIFTTGDEKTFSVPEMVTWDAL